MSTNYELPYISLSECDLHHFSYCLLSFRGMLLALHGNWKIARFSELELIQNGRCPVTTGKSNGIESHINERETKSAETLFACSK